MPENIDIKRIRNIYRIINGASAITLVGLIVTFVVMNGQLILGNLFKFKRVPVLSLGEIIIVSVLDLILLSIFLLFIVYFSIMVAAIKDPWEFFKLFPGVFWDIIKSLFK